MRSLLSKNSIFHPGEGAQVPDLGRFWFYVHAVGANGGWCEKDFAVFL